jgi:hypothetical protein
MLEKFQKGKRTFILPFQCCPLSLFFILQKVSIDPPVVLCSDWPPKPRNYASSQELAALLHDHAGVILPTQKNISVPRGNPQLGLLSTVKTAKKLYLFLDKICYVFQ